MASVITATMLVVRPPEGTDGSVSGHWQGGPGRRNGLLKPNKETVRNEEKKVVRALNPGLDSRLPHIKVARRANNPFPPPCHQLISARRRFLPRMPELVQTPR